MNYKETLFFVGKCLTITHEKHNKDGVENEIISGNVDWDAVVKLSTAHYVFPALYCNLKRTDLLKHIPQDLAEYMEHITNLNRERNLQIIKQAQEINDILLTNNITPIFLKGTGNLLEGLYEDVGERMVGDIDFLVPNSDFSKAVISLKNDGYKEKNIDFIDNTLSERHYPKITKHNRIAAVEIHYKMISDEKYFNYNHVKENLKKNKDNTSVLSFTDQVLITCYNKQINDKGQWYKTPSLRNTYDLYLLSLKTSVKDSLKNNKNFNYLNNFVASSSFLMNNPNSLKYHKTRDTSNFIKKQLFFIKNLRISRYNRKIWGIVFLYKHRLNLLTLFIFNKKIRKYVISRLKSKLNL
ncbi:nucleotidyltransferase family protein [Tenacibaculum sp. TC6]|uniref:nucleotidyltransferase family protein n=1 Tax=Tenacibaculum sp. TC6 TaxID=3423223 RepID=UPI003D35AF1B